MLLQWLIRVIPCFFLQNSQLITRLTAFTYARALVLILLYIGFTRGGGRISLDVLPACSG